MHTKNKTHTYIIILLALFLTLGIIINLNLNNYLNSKQKQNICLIFNKNPKWHEYSKQSQNRWNTPIWIQLAFIYQESKFNANAKAPYKRILGVPIPFKYKSTAYGYSQALNQTWANYQIFINNKSAKRTNFKDSTDFIAWYLYRARKYLKLNNTQIQDLYLAYHEGINGYRKQNFRKNKITILASKKVAKIAMKYKNQLEKCRA